MHLLMCSCIATRTFPPMWPATPHSTLLLLPAAGCTAFLGASLLVLQVNARSSSLDEHLGEPHHSSESPVPSVSICHHTKSVVVCGSTARSNRLQSVAGNRLPLPEPSDPASSCCAPPAAVCCGNLAPGAADPLCWEPASDALWSL